MYDFVILRTFMLNGETVKCEEVARFVGYVTAKTVLKLFREEQPVNWYSLLKRDVSGRFVDMERVAPGRSLKQHKEDFERRYLAARSVVIDT